MCAICIRGIEVLVTHVCAYKGALVLCSRRVIYLLSLCLLLSAALARAQTVSPTGSNRPSGTPLPLEGPVRPDTVAARKAAVQARLEALDHANLSKDDLEAIRAALEQQLKVLTALEDTFRKRETYTAQLESLPQHLDQVLAERKEIEARPPRQFPEVSEQLRDQYEAQLQTTRAEIEDLGKQNATGELRLAGFAKELEQLADERARVEKELLAARSAAAKEIDQQLPLLARVELLDLTLQFIRAQAVTLAAEREWLTKRGPLQDALLGVKTARQKILQQDLETIQRALGQALKQEQAELSTTAAGIERKLGQTADLAEAARLAVGLETVQIRKVTADYRQQLNRIGDRVQAREKLYSQEKQDVDRMTSLVEKYASGERVAQRLQIAFARLSREQARYRDDEVKGLDAQLQRLTEKALDVDDHLYEFDRLAENRVTDLRLQLRVLDATQRDAKLASLQQALDEQKAALREQQQALAALVQDLTRLITLHRERKRLLDDGYRFILTKMFWLRDGQPMNWAVSQRALTGAMYTGSRLRDFAYSELSGLLAGLLRSSRFWVVVLLVFVFLPWAASWQQRQLRARVRTYIAQDVRRQSFGHKTASAVLMFMQTIVWPTYIAVVIWGWPQIFPGRAQHPELQQALIAGLQLAAVFLWLGLLGRAIFRRDGWGQQYIGLQPDLCRFLRRTVTVVWLATLIFLVPRHILLMAPGGPETVTQNLALARLLFTTFLLVLLVLVAITGRRGSCVMQAILAESRARNGLLWRDWPLVYLGILAGMGTVIALDMQGYRYAARSLLLRSAEALLVMLLLMAVNTVVGVIIDRLARQWRPSGERPVDPTQPSHWSLLRQGRQFVRLILVLIGFVAIQHLYGLDQDLLAALNSVHLLEVGKGEAGQPLWLTLGDIATTLLILTGVSLLLRNLPGLYEVALFPRVQWDPGFRYAFLTLTRYFLLLLALWWSLSFLHLRWSSIQWIVAAASVGLGFGLQEIVSNFVSGLILLVERPINVGDYVATGGQEGTVTRITIRATTMQNLDNQTVIIPNKEFIAGQVTNWTLRDAHVRVVIPVGVAYGSDLELVKRLLTQVVINHPKVLRYPAPEVLFRAFGESSLDWEVRCMVPTPRDRFTIPNDLLLQIDQVFREHGVEIPFPQRDLHLRSVDASIELHASGNGYPSGQGALNQPPTMSSPQTSSSALSDRADP
jgi:potassium efflux system protein